MDSIKSFANDMIDSNVDLEAGQYSTKLFLALTFSKQRFLSCKYLERIFTVHCVGLVAFLLY